MDWLNKFPHMQDETLLHVKRSIENGFRGFTSAYGDSVDNFFSRSSNS